MGMFCSCTSANKIPKDKETQSAEEIDAAVQVVVSELENLEQKKKNEK